MISADAPILLLTTGGTIDKVYFDALSDYQVGETTVGRILDIGRVKRPFRIEEILRKDSLE
jgi:L-asparaginase